jgi:hypothetical protein
VRILGEVRKEYADILRRADAIYIEELFATGHYDKISQAFAVFLPVKSVGVMGDGRTYEYVIALRAVETKDFMTADWYPLPFDVLGGISSRIINEVGVNGWYTIYRASRPQRSSGGRAFRICGARILSCGVALLRLPGLLAFQTWKNRPFGFFLLQLSSFDLIKF